MADTETTTKGSKSKPGVKPGTPSPRKGVARPTAVVDALDFDTAMDDASIPDRPERQSAWVTTLDTLYTATEEGKVPRDDEGALKFVKLGEFSNVNGARSQVRSLEKKEYDKTYEFKTVVSNGKSALWARVREVAETE